MKNYELLTVFKPSLDSEELDKAIEKITENVTKLAGSIISTDKIGRKKLAYDIQGYRDGYFTTLIISIPADAIVEFKRNLKLNDNVLRFMFLEVAQKVQAV